MENKEAQWVVQWKENALNLWGNVPAATLLRKFDA